MEANLTASFHGLAANLTATSTWLVSSMSTDAPDLVNNLPSSSSGLASKLTATPWLADNPAETSSGLVSSLIATSSELISSLTITSSELISSLTITSSELISSLTTTSTGLLSNLATTSTGLVSSLTSTSTGLVSSLTSTSTGLLSSMATDAPDLVSSLTSTSTGLVSSLTTTSTGLVSSLTTTSTGLVSRLTSTGLLSNLTSTSWPTDNLTETLSELVSNVTATSSGLVSDLAATSTGLVSTFIEASSGLVSGLTVTWLVGNLTGDAPELEADYGELWPAATLSATAAPWASDPGTTPTQPLSSAAAEGAAGAGATPVSGELLSQFLASLPRAQERSSALPPRPTPSSATPEATSCEAGRWAAASASAWIEWLSSCPPDAEATVAANVSMEAADWLPNATGGPAADAGKEYWALVLILFPLFTVFGNVLVILSVYKERNLHTVTNYFIVSLAVADLLVAALVMPFAVYFLVNTNWELSPTLCDFYIAMDVMCSTSSIFNLVAISIDRFIAVTQPIKYAKHKNNTRVAFTIAIVWIVSAAIGSPIVLGLNTSPDRDPMLCIFYNPDFIIYSSLSSFYIPCIIMVFLYYRIFKVIHERAKKSAAAKKAHRNQLRPDTVIENMAHGRRLKPTSIARKAPKVPCHHKETVTLCVSMEQEQPTVNTESGSQENEDEDVDEGLSNTEFQVIQNEQSADYGTRAPADGKVATPSASVPPAAFPTHMSLLGCKDPMEVNGNHDSGYEPSHVEETRFGKPDAGKAPLERRKSGSTRSQTRKGSKRNGTVGGGGSTVGSTYALSTVGCDMLLAPDGSLSPGLRKKPRFHLTRAHKSSRKKKEKSAAKKERKATKTLAIVLGVFLACWVPFFTCNIVDAICIKLEQPSWQPGMTAFLLTTWLGYMNSFINPVIYTIFNPEFRKAFKKILFEN